LASGPARLAKKPPRTFASEDMSNAIDARFDDESNAPRPESDSGPSAPGNLADRSKENRPLVVAALVSAELTS
jgi:hypothetical protein